MVLELKELYKIEGAQMLQTEKLSDCEQEKLKSDRQIWMQISEDVRHGIRKRRLDNGSDQDLDADPGDLKDLST